MRIDPKRLAVEYYFGNLQYWNFLASPPMLLNRAMTDPHSDTLRECLIRSKAMCEQKKLIVHFER